MPTNFEATRETKAPLFKAVNYFMHSENFPKIHPDFLKDVEIVSKESDTMTLEQNMQKEAL
jgi:hypothetical protein